MCVFPVFAIYQISIALGLKSIMLISFVKSKSCFFFFLQVKYFYCSA